MAPAEVEQPGGVFELFDPADSALVLGARKLWDQALEIWLAGGWAMVGIAAIGLVMFGMGINAHMKLRQKGFQVVPERTWRRWIHHPRERQGPVGDLLDFALGGASLGEIVDSFGKLRDSESAPFERDLRAMKICVSAAPLVGLLGTVTGMLATFAALASGAGGDQTMGLVAEGISEALYTTETGLIIALPGLFMQHQLARQHDRYCAFLAHLESICTQVIYRKELEARVRA